MLNTKFVYMHIVIQISLIIYLTQFLAVMLPNQQLEDLRTFQEPNPVALSPLVRNPTTEALFQTTMSHIPLLIIAKSFPSSCNPSLRRVLQMLLQEIPIRTQGLQIFLMEDPRKSLLLLHQNF